MAAHLNYSGRTLPTGRSGVNSKKPHSEEGLVSVCLLKLWRTQNRKEIRAWRKMLPVGCYYSVMITTVYPTLSQIRTQTQVCQKAPINSLASYRMRVDILDYGNWLKSDAPSKVSRSGFYSWTSLTLFSADEPAEPIPFIVVSYEEAEG